MALAYYNKIPIYTIFCLLKGDYMLRGRGLVPRAELPDAFDHLFCTQLL